MSCAKKIQGIVGWWGGGGGRGRDQSKSSVFTGCSVKRLALFPEMLVTIMYNVRQ